MLMTNYIMNSEITYKIDELDPIANVVTDPGVIVVGKDSKYNICRIYIVCIHIIRVVLKITCFYGNYWIRRTNNIRKYGSWFYKCR